MFTGIVEELGTVVSREGPRLRIAATTVLDDVDDGRVDRRERHLPHRRRLGRPPRAGGRPTWSTRPTPAPRSASCEPGHRVNLERPVRLSDRLGGHLVQGHVDGVGTIVTAAPDLRIECDPDLLRYVVEKGSITIDGISLTVVTPLADGFTVAVIPHTIEVTTLGHKGPGDLVNLEVDITAKYVERLLSWKDG